mgnify:CR=1 FL=1
MGILNKLLKLVTWWNGATIGTHLWCARNGEHVGTDAQGNKYYRSKKAAEGARERRKQYTEMRDDMRRNLATLADARPNGVNAPGVVRSHVQSRAASELAANSQAMGTRLAWRREV